MFKHVQTRLKLEFLKSNRKNVDLKCILLLARTSLGQKALNHWASNPLSRIWPPNRGCCGGGGGVVGGRGEGVDRQTLAICIKRKAGRLQETARTLVRRGTNKTDIYIDVSLCPIRCPSL